MLSKLIVYVNYIRALPAILAYFQIADRACVNRDIERNLGNTNRNKSNSMVFKLVWLLVNKKVFRNVFYYRIKQKNMLFAGLLNVFFPMQHDCEISGDIGPGLAIWHGYGTVISCQKIGRDFS